MNTIYRQGDLLLIQSTLPEGAVKQKTHIILRGEATGHSHALVGGDIFEKDHVMYLVVKGSGKVVHQEHDAIPLSKGVYAVRRQREYLSKDMTKVVID